jgi:hypothetical protein
MLPRPVLFALAAISLLLSPSASQADSQSERRRARTLVSSIARHAALVQTELRFARTARNHERARCLNGKLSEIHAQQRLAYEREIDFGSALATGDTQRANNERVVLSMLQRRARTLSLQAMRCGRFGAIPESGYLVRVIPRTSRVATAER